MGTSPRAPGTYHGISSHRISREEQMQLDQEEQMRLIHDAIKRDHQENDRGAAIIVVVGRELRPEEVEKKWKKHSWQSRKSMHLVALFRFITDCFQGDRSFGPLKRKGYKIPSQRYLATKI